MLPPTLMLDVIIPAYNEASAISRVIGDIPRDVVRHIIVGDNGSTDDTALRATAAGAIVVHAPRRGYGYACAAAMDWLGSAQNTSSPDAVVFLDGDYADDPRELPLLLAKFREGYDLVIGSRTIGQAQKGSLMPQQRFGNWLATRLIRLYYGHSFTDLGPFRLIAWPSLLGLEMSHMTYGWTVEMQVKAIKKGLRCVEVPVSYRPRIGTSKVSGTLKGSVLAGYRILRTIFQFA